MSSSTHPYGAVFSTPGSAVDNDVFSTSMFLSNSAGFGVTHHSLLSVPVTDSIPPGVDPQPEERPVYTCMAYCDMDYLRARSIIWLFSVVIIPSVSIVGLFGNISSILVLYRQGMNKSSNILLMAMAVADTFFLLGTNNILDIWRTFYKTRLNEDQAEAFFFVHMCQNFSMELGNGMSVLLAVLVTLERLVAVFLPLKFTSIVRPFRTRIAVVAVLLIALFKAVWGFAVFTFGYNHKKGLPHIRWTDFYHNHTVFIAHLLSAYDYILGFIPVLSVCAGCILIGVKVSIAAANRAKMLSSGGDNSAQKAPRNSRTTLTLLSVCVLFTCTLGVGFCLETLMVPEKTWKYYIIRYKVTFLLYAINSSSNFIIYVGMNKNFRDTYISILIPWRNTSTDQKSKLVKKPTTDN